MKQATLELDKLYAPRTSMSLANTYEDSMEDAINFFVECFLDYGVSREKNVLIHSLRVGTYLQNIYASETAVVSGVLHDLLESCPEAFQELKQRCTKKVTAAVSANTVDKKQVGWKARYKDSAKRCLKAGEDAFLVRAADLLDNSWNHLRNEREERIDRCLWKLEHLLLLSEDMIQTPPMKQVVSDMKKAHLAVKSAV